MVKEKVIASLLLVLVAAGFCLLTGCGQTSPGTTTTTAPVPASSSVAISGTTATGVTSLGLRTFASVLGTAEVKIGYCEAGSDEVKELGRGTTAPDGTYEVRVLVSSLESLKATGGYVPNLIVTISKEGEIIGCVIPSISPEAGSRGYAPTASKGDYKKAMIARAAFKKGKDPKSFDYSGSIDKKFSSEKMKDYTPGMIDDMGDSIMAGEDAEAKIGEALGISTANMALMRQKGFELSRVYIEPIMQAAFNNKIAPDRAQMDAAFASMEAAMSEYARSLGISEQAIADFKSMKDKQMETKMGESAELRVDPSFDEAKRRMSGDKMINMFLGQWNAADTIATINPAGKSSFATANAAAYNTFVASKETIESELLRLMNLGNTSPEAIPTYMRNAFFDAFIFPPMASKDALQMPDPLHDTQEQMAAKLASIESFMSSYAPSRIMMYFMQTFLTSDDRQTFFNTVQPAMQAVFETRFNNPSSSYYMGPNFWNGTTLGHMPTSDEINTRLTAFNTALVAAVDNNSTAIAIMGRAGFINAQTTTILKSFRILMAPPDAM